MSPGPVTGIGLTILPTERTTALTDLLLALVVTGGILWLRRRAPASCPGAATWAVSLATLAALLICCVVGILFVGAFLDVRVTRPVALCFVVAMAALIGALLCFLREILLPTSGLRPRRR